MAAEAHETQTCLLIVSSLWTGFSARSHPLRDFSTSNTTQYSLDFSLRGSLGYLTRKFDRMSRLELSDFLRVEYEEGRMRADSVIKKQN